MAGKIRKFTRSQSKLIGQSSWSLRCSGSGYGGTHWGKGRWINVLCSHFIIQKNEVAEGSKLLHGEVFRPLHKLTPQIKLSTFFMKNEFKCKITHKKVKIELVICQLGGRHIFNVELVVVLGEGSGGLRIYVSRLLSCFLRYKKWNLHWI